MENTEKNFQIVGKWWNSDSVDLIEVDGSVYAAYGWNGMMFMDCWQVDPADHMEVISDERFIMTPEYEEIEDEDGDIELEIVSYDVRRYY